MSSEAACGICEREISQLSPKSENDINYLQVIGVSHEVSDTITCTDDGMQVHAECKNVWDFLHSLGTDQKIVEVRLKGYRSGKPFDSYMNWPYGLEAPSVNSYRVLTTAFSAMHGIQTQWLTGQILPGECFQVDRARPIMFVQDIDIKESQLVRWYADIAQAVLSHAIILWADAHKSTQKYKDDQEMFLEWSMYEDDWETETEYFKRKRNKAIGHISIDNWDAPNSHRPYQPYPEWANDWKRFGELLGHSINLCLQDIDENLGIQGLELNGFPRSLGDSFDPIQPGVDLMNALGMPATRGVGERPPLQGPYPFKYDGTKWVEIKEGDEVIVHIKDDAVTHTADVTIKKTKAAPTSAAQNLIADFAAARERVANLYPPDDPPPPTDGAKNYKHYLYGFPKEEDL